MYRISSLFQQTLTVTEDSPGAEIMSPQKQEKHTSNYQRPPKCTRDQLLKIRKQLPPHHCIEQTLKGNAYKQKCSITAATKCPEATWLEEYYYELGKQHDIQTQPFLGLSVGCNKGFDALNTLRMGAFDASLDKVAWGNAMSDDGKLYKSVCGQDHTEQFNISDRFTDAHHRQGEMHCIEPMPGTYQKLNHSASILSYDTKGLVVKHAAISKTDGSILFPRLQNAGIENQGLENCAKMSKIKRQEMCENVNVFSLKTYVEKFVQSTGPINILSIDVEGFDFDVILGASSKILDRVEYLEFEYNWMGSWGKQHLFDAVKLLDDHDFTCYWAGVDRLWRLTDCWLSYYDMRTWSNVACVHRSAVPSLASKMETVFQLTLLEEREWTKNPQTKADMERIDTDTASAILVHAGMSTDQDLMTKEQIGR
jgi:FkbM family methyltransferase